MGSRERRPCGPIPAAQGFTLLELIIAITLAGLIMILAFGALRLATRSWTTVESVGSTVDELLLVQGFLRRQLTQARRVNPSSETDQNTTLKGSASRMNFIAPMPGQRLGVWGLYQFTLQFVRVDSGTNLRLNYWLNLPPTAAGFTVWEDQTRTLVKDLEAGKFSYYGKLEPDEPATWHDEWGTDASLPQLVRIRLYSNDRQTQWPELIIPVQAQGSG